MSDEDQIVSPFDNASSDAETADPYGAVATADDEDEFLDLTEENVEKVLDTLRPYLIQDGGDVIISQIDGPVVYLELQGACGTCPSSTMTLKMGLERGLKEKIPEIQEVVQALPDSPDLTEDEISTILDGVRPFLEVAGGNIEIAKLTGVGGLQPNLELNMTGNAASLNSVKSEISQRIQRHFMTPGLRIEWTKAAKPYRD
jgi:Fe-S cluster biogenesis protein NfuA